MWKFSFFFNYSQVLNSSWIIFSRKYLFATFSLRYHSARRYFFAAKYFLLNPRTIWVWDLSDTVLKINSEPTWYRNKYNKNRAFYTSLWINFSWYHVVCLFVFQLSYWFINYRLFEMYIMLEIFLTHSKKYRKLRQTSKRVIRNDCEQ